MFLMLLIGLRMYLIVDYHSALFWTSQINHTWLRADLVPHSSHPSRHRTQSTCLFLICLIEFRLRHRWGLELVLLYLIADASLFVWSKWFWNSLSGHLLLPGWIGSSLLFGIFVSRSVDIIIIRHCLFAWRLLCNWHSLLLNAVLHLLWVYV